MLSPGYGSIRDQLDQGAANTARPEPLPLMADVGRQEDYPVASMGPILSAATQATARHAFAPVSMAAQSILAGVSLAVQGHFNVELPTGQVRPTTLHLVTVGESGDRKSTADDYAMAPVWQLQEELETTFEADRENFAIRQSAWDESKKATTSTYKSKGRAALEEAYQSLGPRPEDPIEPYIVIRSGTTQALLQRFKTHRPSLGLMSDEGGSWLGGYGMTEDNRLLTISTLSDFWDGKTVQMNTVGGGFVPLRGRRLAFHLMIQPILAGRLLGNAEAQGQGFLSRLLVAAPTSLAGTRLIDPEHHQSEEDFQAMMLFRQRMAQILAADFQVEQDNPRVLLPRTIGLSAEATRMWREFYNSLERRVGPTGDLHSVKGFVGKLPEQAVRLAANITIFHIGAAAREISVEQLALGIRLSEFYLSEALRLFGNAAPDALKMDAQLLSDWLRDAWTENLISVTAILQKGPGRVRQGGDHVRDLIEVLVRHDHLAEVPGGGLVSGKKVRQAWRVLVRHG